MTKYIGLVITILGLLLLAYSFSFSLNTYTDRDAYDEAYRIIDQSELGREASFDAFYNLRKSFLTKKHYFQNYGISYAVLGLFLVILTRKGWSKISA